MKSTYQKFVGKRIRLISCQDDSFQISYNDFGTIIDVSDQCSIYVEWDNGFFCSLLPDVDRFEIIFDGEIL